MMENEGGRGEEREREKNVIEQAADNRICWVDSKRIEKNNNETSVG